MLAPEQQHDFVLGQIGVLKLIHQNVFEALLVRSQHFGVVAKQPHHVDEQVVEIHGASTHRAVLILGKYLGVLRVKRPECAVGRSRGRDQLVFPQTDSGLGATRRKPLGVKVQVTNNLGHQPLRICRVVDGETLWVPQTVGGGSQNAHTCGMKRAHPHLVGHITDQRFYSRAHFLRGFVGEGNRQDIHRMHARCNEVRHPMR